MSNTATELMRKSEREVHQRIFEQYMESFQKNWAPKDPYENHQFQTQLHVLIRNSMTHAQQPLLDHISALVAAMPMPPWVPK